MSHAVLMKKTIGELLSIAKEKNVVGRHEMRKSQLADVLERIYYSEQDENAKFEEEWEDEEVPSVVEKPLDEVPDEIEEKIIKHTEMYFPRVKQESTDHEIMLANYAQEDGEVPEIWDEEIQPEKVVREKASYVDAAKIGVIVAFKVDNVKIISGKIEEIHKDSFVIETKNGIKFMVKKASIVWVKTGLRWPRGIYLALKGETSETTR